LKNSKKKLKEIIRNKIILYILKKKNCDTNNKLEIACLLMEQLANIKKISPKRMNNE